MHDMWSVPPSATAPLSTLTNLARDGLQISKISNIPRVSGNLASSVGTKDEDARQGPAPTSPGGDGGGQEPRAWGEVEVRGSSGGTWRRSLVMVYLASACGGASHATAESAALGATGTPLIDRGMCSPGTMDTFLRRAGR